MNKYLKKIIQKILGVYFYPLHYANIITHNRYLRGLLISYAKNIYQNSDDYQISFLLREFSHKEKVQYFDADVAIVMQGPVFLKDNFTYKTLSYYRFIYPNVPIVLSTWKGEISDHLRKDLEQLDVTIIESELPKMPGYGHVNYQIFSSLQGVLAVKEKYNVSYVFKCRTDQIYRKPALLSYLRNIHRLFPTQGHKLLGRLIFLSHTNSFRYFPFFLCDYMTFGYLADVEKLYNVPFETSHHSYKIDSGLVKYVIDRLVKYELFYEIKATSSILERFDNVARKLNLPEVHILKSFYHKWIAEEKQTLLQEYHYFLKNYAIVVDNIDLMFDFYKYTDGYMINDVYTKYGGGLDYSYWLKLYMEDE